jgi:cytochrome c553
MPSSFNKGEQMKYWKYTLVSAAVAAMMLAGCGEKKSETTSHETATGAQVETKTAPVAADASAHGAKEMAAPEMQAPAMEEEPVKEAASAAEEMTAPAKEEVKKQVEQIADSVAQGEAEGQRIAQQKVEEAKKAIDVAALYTKCAGCHGMKGEKHALGQSNIIAGQSKEELIKKIEGYKNGTYGGAMKGLMAGQVKNLTPEEIDALATYISKL